MRFETHCHSEYSNIRLIDCINKLKDIILTANERQYAGVALTDHEALCGHVEWLKLEKELKEKQLIRQDFKCALGNEIYLIDERQPRQKYYHFILIAKNTIGWKALRELSSYSWLNSYYDRGIERVPTLKKELETIVNKYPNSLIATNACIGSELGVLVLNLIEAEMQENPNQVEIYGIKTEIDKYIKFCKKLFHEDFYIEMAPGTSKPQQLFNERIKSIAKFYNCKMVIGTDAHYLSKQDRQVHKAFLRSKQGDREVDEFYQDCYLMTEEEISQNLKGLYSEQELQQMFQNSLEIMNKIESYNIFHNPIIPMVEIEPIKKELDPNLNNYPVLQKLKNNDNNQKRKWIIECLKSLKEKGLEKPQYFERLELEADIIEDISHQLNNNLFAYFNTFQHYIDLFWECGSMVGPGRGSAGAFLSNYLLGITQLDPIEWNLPYFRFLNKERAELPDIDIDLASSKRPLIFQKIREERGPLNIVQIATFGTEGTKAAIACACRGYQSEEFPNGIDVDIAQYLSSLIPVERGLQWTIKDCIEGNEEKGRKPVLELKRQFQNYPGLLEIVSGIEGLVCRRGQHASGVIMYNNSPYDTTALMKSPNGDITTQFDLGDSEALGDTKFDFLITEICDKIIQTIDLLKKDGYFKGLDSLRDIYNEYLHPSKINLNDKRIWEGLESGNIQDIFQFNTQIGKETVKQIKPRNPSEMTAANALLRLTAQEGQERPLTRYIRFKNNINLWYKEMDENGLTKDEQKVLEQYYLRDYGVPASQEQLMLCVMDPNISHFTLKESNLTRKVLAKKQVNKIPEIKEKFLKQCPNKNMGDYVWKTMMLPQLSYSFSEVHALLYSFIGIQTLVLATNFPIIYWNCACLIVNTGGIKEDNKEDNEGKIKTSNYGKVATAIGKTINEGIKIYPPNINKSEITFSPDATNNIIRYGMSGITKIGEDLIYSIIENRPYTSIEDFLSKVKINKAQMITLIKSGAFDDFGERTKLMRQYIASISDIKTKITLQNLKVLLDYNLIPKQFQQQIQFYNFNKYLKKFKNEDYYLIDNIAFSFIEKNCNIDILEIGPSESGFQILQSKWDNIYKKQMEILRIFIKDNHDTILNSLNQKTIDSEWDKYCEGNISKWEMDSISYYFHEHELTHAKIKCKNFFELEEEPEVEKIIEIKGKKIPIFKIVRIAGTVLDKDKIKKSVTILTTKGVVIVKIFGDIFNQYDRQISEKDTDGVKHIIDKSWFTRGNKIIVTGIRKGETFITKKYNKTPYPLIELITNIDNKGAVETQSLREGDEEI